MSTESIDKIHQALVSILQDPYLGDCIDNNRFNTVYDYIIEKYPQPTCLSLIPAFTELLYKSGIDPLEYMYKIPEFAFSQYYGLKVVSLPSHFKIPKNIVSIDQFAFDGQDFVSVDIPGSVKYISAYAFSHCYNLSQVHTSNGVQSIGKSAFYACCNLKNITIPDSVTSLGNSVFQGCGDLVSVDMGVGIQRIPWQTFKNCVFVTNIILHSVKVIEAEAFCNCVSLRELHVERSLTAIEDRAFAGCKKLNIMYDGTVQDWLNIKVEGKLFSPTVTCTDGRIKKDRKTGNWVQVV